MAALIKKYDVPVPRYTSYPTMPYWHTDDFTVNDWTKAVQRSFAESNDSKGISLYVHLPFCESLCTYCACNTRITKNHNVEIKYIQVLLKEWQWYRNVFGSAPRIRELHLGGGTPTFFSPQNLRWLLGELLEGSTLHDDFEFSFEGHPNNTTPEHLLTLFDLGFRRVSFGVQDLDQKVQRTINRIQPFENLVNVTNASRKVGYTSINFDLIYGLPFQSTRTVVDTVEKVLTLRPDRVSYYSYAHVPWLKPAQRGYEDADLPTDVLKRELYEIGRRILKTAGYVDVGMDHFTLPHDSIYKAQADEKLHRNFMGYTTSETDLLIGLGTSAISDAKYAYAQNLKKVEDYAAAILNHQPAVFKGHLQTKQDLIVKKGIIELACHGKIRQQTILDLQFSSLETALEKMVEEGIICANIDGYQVTEAGRAFIRNICSVLDVRMNNERHTEHRVFSKAM